MFLTIHLSTALLQLLDAPQIVLGSSCFPGKNPLRALVINTIKNRENESYCCLVDVSIKYLDYDMVKDRKRKLHTFPSRSFSRIWIIIATFVLT
jgi:hypothetical protein